MQKMSAKLPNVSAFSRREKVLLSVAVTLLAVTIAVACISISIRVNMQNEYTAVRNGIGESLYSNLYMLTQTFDMTSVPHADVQNAIIPQMKNYFAASTALNDALVKCFGARYRLLTDADISAINAAFNGYDTAFRSAASTDLARADMQNCVTRVRELLATRYSEGRLYATR